ncbi:MAG: hypothetical protein DRI61_09025, partial [Chloroflexi bacterium]
MGNGFAVAHKNASFLLFCLHRGATLQTTVKWSAPGSTGGALKKENGATHFGSASLPELFI